MYERHHIPISFLPENKEFPLTMPMERITPTHLFYRRNHLPYPEVHADEWRLSVKGCVEEPLHITYNDLLRLPQITQSVTLECAGNKRSLRNPKTRGEQFTLGAISNAVWTGVPLQTILNLAGIRQKTQEIVFQGMDMGYRTDMPDLVSYSRSLPVTKAIHPNTLLALFMNYEPLPAEHGFPVRLVVPGWYGMNSVKWLRRIWAIEGPFDGPYQTRDYVLYAHPDDYVHGVPITEIQVNSSIAHPTDQQTVSRGSQYVYGIAWSGSNNVVQIHISIDGGDTWRHADWIDAEQPYTWRRWIFYWEAKHPGEYTIMSRAMDSAGAVQALQEVWNVKGYVNNSIHRVKVYVD